MKNFRFGAPEIAGAGVATAGLGGYALLRGKNNNKTQKAAGYALMWGQEEKNAMMTKDAAMDFLMLTGGGSDLEKLAAKLYGATGRLLGGGGPKTTKLYSATGRTLGKPTGKPATILDAKGKPAESAFQKKVRERQGSTWGGNRPAPPRSRGQVHTYRGGQGSVAGNWTPPSRGNRAQGASSPGLIERFRGRFRNWRRGTGSQVHNYRGQGGGLSLIHI